MCWPDAGHGAVLGGSGKGGGRSSLRQEHPGCRRHLVGTILWITHQVSTRGCNFLIGGWKKKKNKERGVEVLLCPHCGQVCLCYFPSSFLLLGGRVTLKPARPAGVLGAAFSFLKLYPCLRPMFPWQAVAHPLCRREQSKPGDGEPGANTQRCLLVGWRLSWHILPERGEGPPVRSGQERSGRVQPSHYP